MPERDDEPYRVNPQKGQYAVLDDSGRAIMICRDEASAIGYAVILNEAYRRGFKAGYREAKRNSS